MQMDGPHKLFDLLKQIVEQLPSLLTLIACMIFAITRWKRHPKVSLLVLISLALLFIHGIAFSIIYNGWFVKPGQYDPTAMRNVYLVLGLLSNGSAALIFAILLGAIFIQREPVEQRG
jgi:nitrogen fixation-related uncharacterized protein